MRMGKRGIMLVAFLSVLAMVIGMVLLGCGKPKPKITSIAPESGEAGAQVKIIGSDFGKTEGTVQFGEESASIVSWYEDKIIVEVPPDLKTGVYQVSVETSAGTSNQTQYEVTEKKEKGNGDSGQTDDEMKSVGEAMLLFAEQNSVPGLGFKIENIQINGDEAVGTAICTTEEHEPALVIVKKGDQGWYGVDFGTGIEPPSWYKQ